MWALVAFAVVAGYVWLRRRPAADPAAEAAELPVPAGTETPGAPRVSRPDGVRALERYSRAAAASRLAARAYLAAPPLPPVNVNTLSATGRSASTGGSAYASAAATTAVGSPTSTPNRSYAARAAAVTRSGSGVRGDRVPARGRHAEQHLAAVGRTHPQPGGLVDEDRRDPAARRVQRVLDRLGAQPEAGQAGGGEQGRRPPAGGQHERVDPAGQREHVRRRRLDPQAAQRPGRAAPPGTGAASGVTQQGVGGQQLL